MQLNYPPHSIIEWDDDPEVLSNLKDLVESEDLLCTGWGPRDDGVFKFMIGKKGWSKESVEKAREAIPMAKISSVYQPCDLPSKAVIKYVLVDLHRFGALKHGYWKEGSWATEPSDATLMSKKGCDQAAEELGSEKKLSLPFSMPVEIFM